MRFKTVMMDEEASSILRRFVNFTNWSTWEKRLAWLENETRRETGMQYFWRERCALELALSSLWRRFRMTRKVPLKKLKVDEFRLLSFAAMVVKSQKGLSPIAKNRLHGMLRDAAKQDYGLGPVAYEMRVACHLMSRGYDVAFQDLEGRAAYDFLATKAGVSVEVECKFMSGDVGRKIHQKQLYRLGDRVSPKMVGYLSGLRSGLLLCLTVSGRLHGKEAQERTIEELLCHAIERRTNGLEEDGHRISIKNFKLPRVADYRSTTHGFNQRGYHTALLQRCGVTNGNALAYFRPSQSAIVIVVESTEKDRVLDGMQRQLLKSAKRQFSSDLPAILSCHLVDLNQEQLLSLGDSDTEGLGLKYMTMDLLRRRPHLFSVSYTAPGDVRQEVDASGSRPETSYREIGPAYSLKNADHALASNELLSVFSNRQS